MMRALVIGARHGSLGAAIHAALGKETRRYSDGSDRHVFLSQTAGLTEGEEAIELNLLEQDMIDIVLKGFQPDVIISTVGVNLSTNPIGEGTWLTDVRKQTEVNFLGPMNLLDSVARMDLTRRPKAVVMISSNSAHIARRNSLGYCASKAALSMAIRCAGREWAGSPLIWGYELGLLAGTPMTRATEAAFGPAQSRMVGAENGLSPAEVARAVVADVRALSMVRNGVNIRLDAGEQ